jgi:glycosyltransferase involved in cell wall biosynthesis
VLILTLNEQVNIVRCLTSVAWSDDVLVLDSFSDDGTVDLARKLGARVHQRAFDNFASQRNYAHEHLGFKHGWVLHLDADEEVPPALRDEIGIAINNSDYDAYRIAPKLIFLGRWLRFSGLYPSYQVRLGRTDRLRFQQVGHGQREVLAPDSIGTLKESYLHHGLSKGLADWIERHNRYSTDEAMVAVEAGGRSAQNGARLFSRDPTSRRRAFKQVSSALPFRPALRFLYMYVIRLGFLDGRAGWTYCRMMAIYEYWTVLKIRELRER